LITYEMIQGMIGTGEANDVMRRVQNDLLKLEVYLTSTQKFVIEEKPVYPNVLSLFTNLGGALSVWMGVSFIMMLEVIEWILDLLLFWCKH
jgi:hypothetical protein